MVLTPQDITAKLGVLVESVNRRMFAINLYSILFNLKDDSNASSRHHQSPHLAKLTYLNKSLNVNNFNSIQWLTACYILFCRYYSTD